MACLLHNAIGKGDVDAVLKLIAVGADVNGLDALDGQRPLFIAVGLSDPGVATAIIEALVAAEADVYETTNDADMLPIHLAVQNPSPVAVVAVIKALVAAGADINDVDAPLHIAATNRNPAAAVAAIQTLLDLGAGLEAVSHHGLTALHCAAGTGTYAALDALLVAGANVHATTDNDVCPLHMAAKNVHANGACISSLIARGADIDAVTDDQETPLHYASYNGDSLAAVAALQALLAAGPRSISPQDYRGITPLHICASRQDSAGVAELVAAGADLDIRDDFLGTPLLWALQAGGQAAKLLIKVGDPATVFAEFDGVLQGVQADVEGVEDRGWVIPYFVECHGFSWVHWANVPIPFPGLDPLLVRANGDDAKEIVRRLQPATVERLRASLMCLSRFVPAAIGCRIAHLAVADVP